MGIGTDNPNPSSQLEIVSGDKGILIPRLTLKSLNDPTAISEGNVESLLVFNTNDVDEVLYKGYYYWDGNRWVRLLTDVQIEDVLSSERTSTALSANQGRILSEVKLDKAITVGHIYIGGVSNIAERKVVSGDALLNDQGVLSLNNDVVSSDELSQMGASDKQILRWNGDKGIWEASQAGNRSYTEVFQIGRSLLNEYALSYEPIPGFDIDNFKVTINGFVLGNGNFTYDRTANTLALLSVPVAQYDTIAITYQSND